MSAPFLAEIRVLQYTFAPEGWAACDGQVLPISQNTALFKLLGKTYGGDGTKTFALPNLQGAAPMFWGKSGTSQYKLGQSGGAGSVTLVDYHLPQHTHSLNAVESDSVERQPGDQYLATGVGVDLYDLASQPTTIMSKSMVTPTGDSGPHNNMQHYLSVQFCIALAGVYPPPQ
jgi:microcystin-dependent protein